jgi:CO/xanthine dehydrogenase FAD-binding subunit
MQSTQEEYARPRTLAEAVAAVAGRDALILAGGTDVYPAHVGKEISRAIVDLSRVEGLRGIGRGETHHRIGAATTWSDVIRAELPAAFDALKQAAREVGSVQIQNRGTVGGNLCNASPAADGIPPLLALDAEVELAGKAGMRQMPLQSFLTGYRKTALAQGEILSAILVPNSVDGASSAFVKLGARRYLVISIVMAAAVIKRDGDGRISDARVAAGAASAVAQRLGELERDLEGFKGRPSSLLEPRHIAPLSPIDDIRATASYRRDAALTLIGQALDRAAGTASDV